MSWSVVASATVRGQLARRAVTAACYASRKQFIVSAATMGSRPKHVQKYELNCDMGEGFGKWKMGPDEELMNYIDVANIACGFHAGDPSTMLKTIRMAKEKGVKTGAHPGLQDLFGFGRRRMEIDPDDMYAMILYQVGSLKAMLDAEGLPLHHIKPHGELYFYMQRDAGIMRAVLRACAPFGVPIYACKNPAQATMCAEEGVEFVGEFYPDVEYTPDGNLLPMKGSREATLVEIEERMRRAVDGDVRTDVHGGEVKLGFAGEPFTTCLHSDKPNALENAKITRKVLDEANKKRFG